MAQSQQTTRRTQAFADTTSLLRYLYEDVRRLHEVASDDIALHSVDRDLFVPPKPPLRGVEAVQAYEEQLVDAAGGVLVMEVSSITANNDFGVVLGTLRTTREGVDNLEIPFCGVWKFRNGVAIEHWENVKDAAKLGEWMATLPAQGAK